MDEKTETLMLQITDIANKINGMDFSETTWRPVTNAIADLVKQTQCPCCKDGISITGEPCQECHGTANIGVAYESLRFHYKKLTRKD